MEFIAQTLFFLAVVTVGIGIGILFFFVKTPEPSAGMLLFGPLADAVQIDLLLVATGIIIALLCVPFMMSNALREAGKPAA